VKTNIARRVRKVYSFLGENHDMATPTAPETSSVAASEVPVSRAAQCVILNGISWETYERLLTEHHCQG